MVVEMSMLETLVGEGPILTMMLGIPSTVEVVMVGVMLVISVMLGGLMEHQWVTLLPEVMMM